MRFLITDPMELDAAMKRSNNGEATNEQGFWTELSAYVFAVMAKDVTALFVHKAYCDMPRDQPCGLHDSRGGE